MIFFFFKQKTAYEMRISDWSSDVCSSDLKLVPVDSQLIIPYLSWLRYAGLAILLLIEIRLALILFKLVFKPDTTESQLQESGMPPLLAKAALLEARFWRWVFGVFGR